MTAKAKSVLRVPKPRRSRRVRGGKPIRKSVTLNFGKYLEAMALVDRALDLFKYHHEKQQLILAVAVRHLGPGSFSRKVSITVE